VHHLHSPRRSLAWAVCRCKILGMRLLNRRLSDMATRALAHFAARAERAAALGGGAGSLELSGRARAAAAVALEDLLLWLASYRCGLTALLSCILVGVSVDSGCVERACRWHQGMLIEQDVDLEKVGLRPFTLLLA